MSVQLISGLSLFVCLGTVSSAGESAASGLPRSTPEKEGISSAAILDFIQAADQKIDAIHSFMLVRHGSVVAEGWWSPYGAQIPHTMFSLSKSFTSTAVGLALEEGKLSLDDPVLKFFPEDAPPAPSDNLKAMRVRDLLIMSSGQHSNVVSDFAFDSSERLTKEFLALPVEHKPGTFFFYNTPGSYMLSAIVQKVTGMTMLDYLRPRLFEPLGIAHPTWETSAQGISLGGYGLSIRTEDIARFGLLYLRQGNWEGKQLVPASWVAAATSRQTSNGSDPNSDWEQGYGYQFWRARHGLYRGDGAFGQFCIVMPDQDAVVAITSGTKNMAGVMNLVWDKLLPALQAAPLPADPTALNKLNSALAALTLHPPADAPSARPGPAVSGRKYAFLANDQKVEAVTLEWSNNGGPVMLALRCDGVEQRIACGRGNWIKGRLNFVSDVVNHPSDQPIAASGAWTGDGVYTAKIAFYETPFCVTISLRFSGDQVFYNAEYNVVRRGPSKLPELIGRAL